MHASGGQDRTAIGAAGADLYRALFRCSSDGLILLDHDTGSIREANAAAGLLAGRTPESLAGLHLVDLVEAQDAERVDGALRSARESGASLLDISLVRLDPSGSRPVSVHMEALAGGVMLALLHDVTEKARLLEMVRREKEMSRSLLETVNACVLGVDVRGRVTLLNRTFRETVGQHLSDLLGRDAVSALVVERDRPAARRALESVMGGAIVEEMDLAVGSPTGERVLSFNGALVRDAREEPVGVIWVAIDVTGTRRLMEDARRGEERTQRSLQQLKEFSRVSSMILQERDLDRVCRMFVEAIRDVSTFNRAILTLCDDEFRGYQWYFAGLSEKEIAVFHQNKLTSRERVTIFQERFRLGNSYYIPHDEGWHYEGVPSAKPSESMVDWHPDDFLFIPLFGSNRKIVGIVSVDDPADGRRPTAESISPLELFANQVAHAIEEKKLDQEVKKTTERYRTLVETMNDGLFTLDLRETITFVNPALLQLTGRQVHEVVGRPISVLMTPDAVDQFRRRTEGRWPSAGMRFELTLLAKDDSPIPVLISATPYLMSNTKRGYFAIVSDLRDQKKAEEERRRMHEEVLHANVKLRDSMSQLQAAQEQLIQAEKLSALGELISGVAHELNNPLTGVMGYSQLMMSADVEPEIKRSLERIHKEAVRCQRIVQNLLAFARRHRPERKLVDVNQVLHDTLELRAYQLKVDGVDVNVDPAPDLSPVLADSYQIQQVFLNIINNAHQALMEISGPKRLLLRTRQSAGSIRIEFVDNGPGIAEDKIGKIFDPFFTTKEIGRGTGLGLSLSYGIVREHEGQILVRSELGAGATFTVELPAQSKGAVVSQKAEPAAPGREDAPRGRILVVDDEETILDLLMAMLGGFGHRVETAGNGRQALDKIRESDFDVIISDLKMPDMGGQKLYEAIRGIKPHLLDRMIFFTGDTVNPGTQAFFQRTGSPYLSKPFRLEEVDDLVAKVLTRRPPRG